LKCYVISLNILNYFLDLGIRPKNMIAFRTEHDIKYSTIYSGQCLTIIPLFVDISFHYNILVIRENYHKRGRNDRIFRSCIADNQKMVTSPREEGRRVGGTLNILTVSGSGKMMSTVN